MHLRLGVSACLLGEAVRYDGTSRHIPLLTGFLAEQATLLPVCPEVGMGLGVPRETIHLVEDKQGLHLRGTASAHDHTQAMRDFLAKKINELGLLHGFILKARSPSCGIREVPVFPIIDGTVTGPTPGAWGAGLFVRLLQQHYPGLPLVDESGCQDHEQLERFLDRARDYAITMR